MATSGENYWPPTGRTSWPLTHVPLQLLEEAGARYLSLPSTSIQLTLVLACLFCEFSYRSPEQLVALHAEVGRLYPAEILEG